MSTPARFCPQCGSPIEAGFRTCANCGDPAAQASPPGTATALQATRMTPAGGGSNMPSVAWFILGLLSASLVGGGAFALLKESPPPGAAYDNLSPAEKEKVLKSVMDDLPEDPIKIENEKLIDRKQ